MLSLVLAILFGLGITYFAFQNSVGVPINFADYHLIGIPLFYVVVTAVISGILMAWVISAVNSMSSFMRIRGKDSVISKDKKEIHNLQSRSHELEVENAKLRTSDTTPVEESRHEAVIENEKRYKSPFFSRLLHPRA